MTQRPRFAASTAGRRRADGRFRLLAAVATAMGVVALGVLLVGLAVQGWDGLSLDFLRSFASRFAERAGFRAAIAGSVWCVALTGLFAIPMGLGAAVYLEEYTRQGRLHRVLEVVIANLAGVPSVLYGMLGLLLFVRGFDALDEPVRVLGVQLPLGRSVLAGGLTLALLVLPVIIVSAREALRAVPDSLRQAAYGVGATRWQCVLYHVLPSALPGVLTGVVLSLSRALGETAPLIMIGGLAYVAFVPSSPNDPFTTMPIQIFNWAARPQVAFHQRAATGILVLLGFLLLMNATAVLLRDRFERNRSR